MKSFLIALLLTCSIGVVAYAAHTTEFVGCTSDNFAATLTLDIADSATPAIYKEIAVAFQKTAAQLTVVELVGHDGFATFRELLTEADWDAIEDFNGPPTVAGACK